MEEKEMKAETMVSKISEELKKILDTNERSRNEEIERTLSSLLSEDSGSVDSCFKLRQLMVNEDSLRKMKNNYEQWPKAVRFIIEFVEKHFDKFYYDIDYEIRDSYSFWIIINNSKALCIELEKAGCREFDDTSCTFKWGIVDRRKIKYIDKFSTDATANVADYLSLDRMISTFCRVCDKIKIK